MQLCVSAGHITSKIISKTALSAEIATMKALSVLIVGFPLPLCFCQSQKQESLTQKTCTDCKVKTKTSSLLPADQTPIPEWCPDLTTKSVCKEKGRLFYQAKIKYRGYVGAGSMGRGRSSCLNYEWICWIANQPKKTVAPTVPVIYPALVEELQEKFFIPEPDSNLFVLLAEQVAASLNITHYFGCGQWPWVGTEVHPFSLAEWNKTKLEMPQVRAKAWNLQQAVRGTFCISWIGLWRDGKEVGHSLCNNFLLISSTSESPKWVSV